MAVAVAVIIIVEIIQFLELRSPNNLHALFVYDHMESMKQCITLHLSSIFGESPSHSMSLGHAGITKS